VGAFALTVWGLVWPVDDDFNEAMRQYEHFSETPRPERQMLDFREVLSHCDLHDGFFRPAMDLQQ
jgi:hypothetical protein